MGKHMMDLKKVIGKLHHKLFLENMKYTQDSEN